MDWVPEPGPGDEVVTDKGLTVLVDRKASLFLIGSEMDYQVKDLTSGFTFSNPNEKGRCGCARASTSEPAAQTRRSMKSRRPA